jgi:hypothetical protein
VVLASFQINSFNAINDEDKTFEFSGVLTLQWRDPRAGFDPATAGVREKVYSGAYQFDEISPGWYPQVVLINESGAYEKSGTVLRVQPDGTQTLIESVNAIAETEMDFKRFPFDRHRLEAIFEVLGFGKGR